MRRGSLWRQILALLIGLMLLLFALLNLSSTEVNFVVFSVSLPVFLVVIGAGALGFLAGVLLSGRGR